MRASYKRWGRMLVLTSALLMGGCGLFQKEVEHNPSLLITADTMEYEFACVNRGDLVKTDKVICSYVPVAKEDYSFSKDGELYSGIYVKKGDIVKQGDLLAELDTREAKQELSVLSDEYRELEVELACLEQEKLLMMERQQILLGKADRTERLTMETEASVGLRYDLLLKEKRTHLSELAEGMRSLQEEVEAGRIYASIDGTVTYVKEITSESTTSAGSRVVTVSDQSQAFFKATTRYKDRFTAGTEWTVLIDKEEYPVEAVDAEQYGLSGSGNEVYFRVIGETFTLEQGDKGNLELVLEEKREVLYLPEDAVVTLGDDTVVFFLDDNGVRKYKNVIIGTEINGCIEIIDGVNEGEQVIIG